MEKVEYVGKRGSNKIALGLKNKEKVREWFLKNKGGTQSACIKETGLTNKTVSKHLTTILKEQE